MFPTYIHISQLSFAIQASRTRRGIPSLGLLLIAMAVWASPADAKVELGKGIPSFYIKSGDNQEFTHKQLQGKIGVIFYETRETKDRNRPAQEAMMKFYHRWGKAAVQWVVRLAVIDASSSFWPINLIWRRQLRKHSEEWKLTIYADWAGKMRKAWGLAEGESHLIVVDHRGKIRMIKHGLLTELDVFQVKDLLQGIYQELLANNAPR